MFNKKAALESLFMKLFIALFYEVYYAAYKLLKDQIHLDRMNPYP